MDRRRFLAASLAMPFATSGAARAQSGPVSRMIFPFSAGGSGDALCRLLAPAAAPVLDRNVIVENRTGGDGLIGIKAVKGAPPDGSMILVTTGPTMYLLPMVETDPSFDAGKDFVPVSLLARFDFCVVAGKTIAATSFKDFVAEIKASREKASFGVPSQGTIPHFTGARLEQVLGVPMTRVPYRGSAPIISDLVGGHLPFAVTTVADAIAQHRAGGVRMLAVASAQRSPFVPEVPTLREEGIDLAADGWYGLWLPAGASPDLASRLSAAMVDALSKPEIKDKAQAIGLTPVGTSPDGLTKQLAADTAFWQPIVKATGYKVSN